MTSHDDERYRREQEEFVSNHGGSSSREVLLAIVPNVCGVLLVASTLALHGKRLNRNARNCIEFALTVMPCVLCCTVWSESVAIVAASMLAVSIGNTILVIFSNQNYEEDGAWKSAVPHCTGRRPFITNFRALTNLITAVCILAVDFSTFPRKYAKTETTGYSLMDTGVGLFVIANAIVSPEARDSRETRLGTVFERMRSGSKASVKNSAPLLILGIGRFAAVEYSSYQKHVTEYGVHWNFFVTLAFAKMFASSLASIFGSGYSLPLGVSIVMMHEWALNAGGLQAWVLGDSPRFDFVSANREGLSSVPGYVGLYLIGVAIGRLVHSTYKNSRKFPNVTEHGANLRLFGRSLDFAYSESMVLCVKLSLIAVQACAATLYCDARWRVSRRLANGGYCSWIVTLACTLMTLLLLVEIVTDVIARADEARDRDKKSAGARRKKRVGFDLKDTNTCDDSECISVPEIFEAINYNGLAFFLIANLFTGLVNMFVRTLYVRDFDALLIIIGYMAFCIIIIVALYRRHIQIKL